MDGIKIKYIHQNIEKVKRYKKYGSIKKVKNGSTIGKLRYFFVKTMSVIMRIIKINTPRNEQECSFPVRNP